MSPIIFLALSLTVSEIFTFEKLDGCPRERRDEAAVESLTIGRHEGLSRRSLENRKRDESEKVINRFPPLLDQIETY